MALYAFDGTWNDANADNIPADTERYTNVYWFSESYEGRKLYLNGPGTRGGLVGKILGGFSGMGASRRVEEGFAALKQNFSDGDTQIDIVGYSRGAAIARMFVEMIREQYDTLHKDGKALSVPPTIRFLGLFDTVASFGLPWTTDEGDFIPDIPDFVKHTFHAMALDESRETFGIERCVGDRAKITEVWFRGGHGDIGGNAVVKTRGGFETNRGRSDFPLNWMVLKAKSCGLSMHVEELRETSPEAPVTASEMKVEVGNAGTMSRRLYLGDLVHYSVENSEMVETLSGRMLRRIDVPTRIEDPVLENRSDVAHWTPVNASTVLTEVSPLGDQFTNPRLVELGSRRYPFDIQPARTWRAWLEDIWDLDPSRFDRAMLSVFWAPGVEDRALAWDVLVELVTRIATQNLAENEGDEGAALNSIYQLFPTFREFLHQHGPAASNIALLVNTFLNQQVRPFTAKWHKCSVDGNLGTSENLSQFRKELGSLQPKLRQLQQALEIVADARLQGVTFHPG